jgi:hypothetical protein
MKKPLLGLLLGGVLGVLDGLSAMISAPEVAPQLATIVLGSTFKGLVAGLAIGFFARRFRSLPLGIVAGLAIGVVMALPFALGTDPTTGEQYFWEIMLPGALTGMIVGFATQRYPMPKELGT